MSSPTLLIKKPFITRPLPAALSLKEELQVLGLDPILCPLTKLVPQKIQPFPLSQPLAFITTSSFAIDQLASLSPDRITPLYVVGSVSAHIAYAHGFQEVYTPESFQVSSLKDLIFKRFHQSSGTLIYMRGQEITQPFSFPPESFLPKIQEIICYGAQPLSHIPDKILQIFQKQEVSPILLFSTRAAQIFFQLIKEANLDTQNLSYLCLSPKIASTCRSLGATSSFSCPSPTQESLIQTFKSYLLGKN